MTMLLDRGTLPRIDEDEATRSARLERLLASPPPDVPVRRHRDAALDRLGLREVARRWTDPVGATGEQAPQRVARPA